MLETLKSTTTAITGQLYKYQFLQHYFQSMSPLKSTILSRHFSLEKLRDQILNMGLCTPKSSDKLTLFWVTPPTNQNYYKLTWSSWASLRKLTPFQCGSQYLNQGFTVWDTDTQFQTGPRWWQSLKVIFKFRMTYHPRWVHHIKSLSYKFVPPMHTYEWILCTNLQYDRILFLLFTQPALNWHYRGQTLLLET